MEDIVDFSEEFEPGDFDAFGEQQESEAKVYGTNAAVFTFQVAKILELWHEGIRPSDDSPRYRQS